MWKPSLVYPSENLSPHCDLIKTTRCTTHGCITPAKLDEGIINYCLKPIHFGTLCYFVISNNSKTRSLVTVIHVYELLILTNAILLGLKPWQFISRLVSAHRNWKSLANKSLPTGRKRHSLRATFHPTFLKLQSNPPFPHSHHYNSAAVEIGNCLKLGKDFGHVVSTM